MHRIQQTDCETADSEFSRSFSIDQIVSDEKSNDTKSFRIVKLVVIGPKICENSHSYFQNWFLDPVSKINLKYPYLDSLRRNSP